MSGNHSDSIIQGVFALVILAIFVAIAALGGCTDERAARKALADAGYSEVRVTGYAWFGCGEGDWYSTGFQAKGPTGRNVSGVVCSSWVTKGATIRFY